MIISVLIQLFLVFGIWYLVFGIWYLIFDIWYLVFDIWYLVFGIWYLVFGIWLFVPLGTMTDALILNWLKYSTSTRYAFGLYSRYRIAITELLFNSLVSITFEEHYTCHTISARMPILNHLSTAEGDTTNKESLFVVRNRVIDYGHICYEVGSLRMWAYIWEVSICAPSS